MRTRCTDLAAGTTERRGAVHVTVTSKTDFDVMPLGTSKGVVSPLWPLFLSSAHCGHCSHLP